jgi:hypothetical protein
MKISHQSEINTKLISKKLGTDLKGKGDIVNAILQKQ